MSSETENKDILYVEDNPANIRLMEAYFGRFSHITLHICQTGEDGLEKLQTLRPDLILMDINLPGISGIETTQKILATPELNGIPVIALTAAAMKQNIDAAAGLFEAYITKPIDFAELAGVLQPYL